MNITIIGASAGVGLAAVKRALELQHKVTTLSRRKVEVEPHQNLTQLHGSAINTKDLSQTINSADAILVTLGTNNKIGATTLFSDFARTLLQIHSQNPIKAPIITLTGFGSGKSRPYLPWYYRMALDLVLGKVYTDKAEMEKMILSSSLRWEFVLAWFLTDQPLSQKYSVEPDLRTGIPLRKISRADVADYMVNEALEQSNIGKYTTLIGK